MHRLMHVHHTEMPLHVPHTFTTSLVQLYTHAATVSSTLFYCNNNLL